MKKNIFILFLFILGLILLLTPLYLDTYNVVIPIPPEYFFTTGILLLISLFLYFIIKGFFNRAEDFVDFLAIFNVVVFSILIILLTYPAFFLEKGFFINGSIKQIKETSDRISELELKINQLQISDDIEVSIEKTKKLKELNEKVIELKLNLANLQERHKVTEEDNYSLNLFYIVRAISLGSLGAIIIIFAKSYHFDSSYRLFSSNKFWPLIANRGFVGGLISIVVFSLFYTKQITIFSNGADQISQQPDYFRTTLLCIVSGAFSDKVYNAVSKNVDKYVEQDKKG